MTTTALMPVDPSVSPQQAARILTIRADLLPPEIRDGRRALRIRSLIVFLLVATVGVLGAWYWQVTLARQDAEAEYDKTFGTLTDVRNDQRTDKLKALVEYQDGSKALNAELTAILAKDLSWTNLINLLSDRATDTEVVLTEMTATLNEDTRESADKSRVGTLTLNGEAANKRVVADFVNELGDLKDLSNPFVTSVNSENGIVRFSLSVTITDQALCGRFSDDCPSGGK